MKGQFDDKKAVEKAKKNSIHFVDLYDYYFEQIFRYVYRRVDEIESAEDIVSQTFFDALNNLSQFEFRGFPFSSWLYKIAHNNVLKWYKHKSRMADLEIEKVKNAFVTEQTEDIVDLRIEKEMVLNVLEKMDFDYQEIIRLKYFEELTNIEIAKVMGINANNAGVKLFRALKKLKELLENEKQ